MHAFIEILCEHMGVVRAGPLAHRHGDPYVATCFFRITTDDAGQKTAELIGLTDHVDIALVRAAKRALNEADFRVTWKRLKDDPYTLTDSPEGNKMHVQKIKAPHANDAIKASKPDWPTIKATTLAMIDQVDAGHYTIDAIGQVDPNNNSHADEQAAIQAIRSLKPNQSILWFVRGEQS